MALITPFAENGNRATIPATTSDGSVSYDQGFGSFYALPPEEGGLFIDRAQFNQLMYDTTSAVISNQNSINTLNSKVADIQSTMNQVISSDVTPIGAYKQVENKTVGANGDFKTIQEAFVYAQTHRKQELYQRLTIKLLENLSGDLIVLSAWYPYLSIDCNGFTLAKRLSLGRACMELVNLKVTDGFSAGLVMLDIRGAEVGLQSENLPACITVHNSIMHLSGNITLRPRGNRAGIMSRYGSSFFVASSTITQSTGTSFLSCSDGGLIQLTGGANLTGVTVPKANQGANTLTRNGIIFGNYTI